jgi:hypothetical protein
VELERLKQKARDLRHTREQQHESPSGDVRSAPVHPPNPAHSDSGGGAAQFRTKGGDNSIQESGVEAGAAERERAAAALHAYLDSRVAHRWAAACEYMAASLVVALQRAVSLSQGSTRPGGCPAILAPMSKRVPQSLLKELAEVDVGSLRLKGDRGFLLYHGPRGKDYVMAVVREAGGWKMANLDGTALP